MKIIFIEGKQYKFDGNFVYGYGKQNKILLIKLLKFNPYLSIKEDGQS